MLVCGTIKCLTMYTRQKQERWFINKKCDLFIYIYTYSDALTEFSVLRVCFKITDPQHRYPWVLLYLQITYHQNPRKIEINKQIKPASPSCHCDNKPNRHTSLSLYLDSGIGTARPQHHREVMSDIRALLSVMKWVMSSLKNNNDNNNKTCWRKLVQNALLSLMTHIHCWWISSENMREYELWVSATRVHACSWIYAAHTVWRYDAACIIGSPLHSLLLYNVCGCQLSEMRTENVKRH